ncbi:unnamed protein product [Auanema sp. JU1783]|nr:unnamed protein product [Auanema sp. JU1783]
MRLPLLLLLCSSLAETFFRSCYYSLNDPPVSLIEKDLCSHIILIGKANVNVLGLLETPDVADNLLFKSIKKYSPNSKLIICITGANPSFSQLVSSPTLIERFVDKVFAYVEAYQFDGIDLDWEFPTWSADAKKTDKHLFSDLLMKINEKFGGKYMLTVAVSGPPTITKVAYDVNSLNKYVDFVQVMNYDFHIFSYLYPVVGFNAPLRKLKGEQSIIGQMNSEASMAKWKNMGLWSNKTLFGIPTYSRAYLLVNKYLHEPFALAEKTIDTLSKRAVVCELLKDTRNYFQVWNNRAASPYAYGNDKTWISFENEKSVKQKALYAYASGVAGVMIYDIGSDDYYGSCGNGTFPLLKAINAALGY